MDFCSFIRCSVFPFYICRKSPAIRKYVHSEIMSVMDAIIGPAISAGSIPIFFASIGSIEPISLAIMTMSIMDTHTVMATIGGLWSR